MLPALAADFEKLAVNPLVVVLNPLGRSTLLRSSHPTSNTAWAPITIPPGL